MIPLTGEVIPVIEGIGSKLTPIVGVLTCQHMNNHHRREIRRGRRIPVIVDDIMFPAISLYDNTILNPIAVSIDGNEPVIEDIISLSSIVGIVNNAPERVKEWRMEEDSPFEDMVIVAYRSEIEEEES